MCSTIKCGSHIARTSKPIKPLDVISTENLDFGFFQQSFVDGDKTCCKLCGAYWSMSGSVYTFLHGWQPSK